MDMFEQPFCVNHFGCGDYAEYEGGFCKSCRKPQTDPGNLSNEAPGSKPLADYLAGRRKTIEASIAVEHLAGNAVKEQCEKTALAEIEAMQQWNALKGL